MLMRIRHAHLTDLVFAMFVFLFGIGCTVRPVLPFDRDNFDIIREFTLATQILMQASFGVTFVSAFAMFTLVAGSGRDFRIAIELAFRSPVIISFLIFHLIVSVRLCISRDLELQPLSGVVMCVAYAVICTWVNIRIDHSQSFQKKILAAFALYLIALYSLTIFECILHPEATYNQGNGRWYGLESGPTFLGTHAAILLLIVLNSQLAYLLKFLAIVPAVVAIVANGARGGGIALLVGVTAIVSMRILARPKKMVFWITISIPFVLFALIGMLAAKPDWRLLSLEDTRTQVWKTLIDEFLSSPLLGVGGDVSHSENSYLRALAMTGLLGFGFLVTHIVLLLVQFIWSMKNGFSQKEQYWFPIICAIFVHSFVDGDLVDRIRLPVVTWWVTIASVATAKVVVERPTLETDVLHQIDVSVRD